MNPGIAKIALHNDGAGIKRHSARMLGLLLLGITAAAGVFAQAVSASKPTHQQYRVVILPVDGGADSAEPGYLFYAPLNNRGTVAVSGDTGTPGVSNSYTWTAGRQRDLSSLPPLGTFSGSNTYVNWINQWGLSAGFATRIDSVSGTSVDNAVIWTPDGTIFDLVGKSNAESHAVWVNDLGEVSGWMASSTADPCSFGTGFAETKGFIWQFGTLRLLGSLGGTDSYGEFINDLGQVSGHAQTSDTTNTDSGCPPFDPFIWQDGIIKDINPGNFGGAQGGTNFLSNGGYAVGFGTAPGEIISFSFRWHDGKLIELDSIGNLGGALSTATNVNDRGHVVGFDAPADNAGVHAVLWRDETFTDLSTLSEDDCSEPFRINNNDQIVGVSFSCETGASHAFIWERGEMLDLDTLIPSAAGIQLTSANWITDDGLIAAQGVLSAGSDMGATREVLLIPNGECDPAVQAASAQDAKISAAVQLSSAALGTARKPLVFGADGRIDPMFFKPFSMSALRGKILTQSN
jgi:probable HAF family extracellular repeat protein